MENQDDQTLNAANQEPVAPAPTPVAPQQAPVAPQAVQTQAMPTDLEPIVSSGGKGKKLWLIIVAVVIVVLLGVGGWWYYAKGQVMILHNQMTWNWGNTFTNFKTETSFALRVTQPGINAMQTIMPIGEKMEISGDIDQHTVGTNFTGQGMYLFDIGEEMNIDFNLEYKKVGDVFYIKPDINGLDKLGLPFPMEIGDEWISFDPNNLPMMNPMMQQPTTEQDYSKQMEEFNKSTGELMEKIKNTGAFSISDPHKTIETPDGTLRKIQYNIKPNKLADLIIVVSEHFDSKVDLPEGVLDKPGGSTMREEFLEFQKEEPEDWAEMKAALAKLNIYAWVNTETKHLQGFEVSARNLALPNEADPDAILTFSLENMFYSAEPINIVAPEDAISFEQLMAKMMGEAMGVEIDDEVMVALMDQTDTDEDGLPDAIETMVFETDPNNPDSDGDSYLDGEEVDNGYNPLGEGELDQAFYEAKLEELMGGSLGETMVDNEQARFLACTESGGEWILVQNKTEAECAIYTDEAMCDNSGCDWDSLEDPEMCMPPRNHCKCPNGVSIWSSGDGIATCPEDL